MTVEEAYDKGVEDGKREMLNELMDSFFENLTQKTKEKVLFYCEANTWTCNPQEKNKIVGYEFLKTEQ